MTDRTELYATPLAGPHPIRSGRFPSGWRMLAGAAALAAVSLLASACVVAPYGPAYGAATYGAPPPLPHAWVPPGYVQISFGGVAYLYGDGYFHRWHDHRLVVVAPPYGAVVPALPHGYREVRQHRGGRYYTYRGTYYQRGGRGWKVVRPPRWRR